MNARQVLQLSLSAPPLPPLRGKTSPRITFKVNTPPLPKPYLSARPFMRDTPRMRAAEVDKPAPPAAAAAASLSLSLLLPLSLPSSPPSLASSSSLGAFFSGVVRAAAATSPPSPPAVVVSAVPESGPGRPSWASTPPSALVPSAVAVETAASFPPALTSAAAGLVDFALSPAPSPLLAELVAFVGVTNGPLSPPASPEAAPVMALLVLPAPPLAAAAVGAGTLEAEGGLEMAPVDPCLLVFFGNGEDANGAVWEEEEDPRAENRPLGPLAKSSAEIPS